MDSGDCFIAFVLLSCFGLVILPLLAPPIESKFSIISINDGSQTDGSFFLGSGYISEDPFYVTYATTDRGYILLTIPAYQTEIIEDEDNNPYVHKRAHITKIRYEIHVPHGTIIRQFNLDGKL